MNDKLIAIQQTLKVPKDEYNSFGGYKYRNIEGIEEKLKPLLAKQGLSLRLEDDIVLIGDWVYVKATAILSDGSDEIRISALARESETKKGMDASQITGASSSYARKYALSGLFLIDDTKDADSRDNGSNAPRNSSQSKSASADKPASDKQKKLISDKLSDIGIANEDKKNYLVDEFGVIDTSKMSSKDASMIIESLIGG